MAAPRLTYREILELPREERVALRFAALPLGMAEVAPCDHCGTDIRPTPGEERCEECGKPAPLPCGFCGRLITPERVGRLELCPDKSCRQLADKYRRRDALPPAYERPSTGGPTRSLRYLLLEAECNLEARKARWAMGEVEDGIAENLSDIWAEVRLAKLGKPRPPYEITVRKDGREQTFGNSAAQTQRSRG